MSGCPWTSWSRIGKSARSASQSIPFCCPLSNVVSAIISEQSELELGGVTQHGLVPGRVPDQFNVSFLNAFNGPQLLLHLLSQHRAHAAARRRQRHFHTGSISVTLTHGLERAI